MRRRHFLVQGLAIVAAALLAAATTASAQAPGSRGNACAQGNVACQCSYRCCGEERC